MLIIQDILILVEDFAPDLGWERNNFAKSDGPLIVGLDEEQLEPLLGAMLLNETSTKPYLSSWNISPVIQAPEDRATGERRSSGSPTIFPPLATLSGFGPLPIPTSGNQISNSGTASPKLCPPLNSDATRVHIDSPNIGVQSIYEKRRRNAGSGSSNNNNNRVDIERIRRGGDVRTTVCCPCHFEYGF